MKRITIISMVLFALFSCKVKEINKNKQGTINVVSQRSYDNYIFYLGIDNAKDTIMFISSKKIIEDCGLEKIESISMKNAKQIESMKVGRDSIYFKYKVVDLNGQHEFFAGNGKPGDDKVYVHSYSSYPYVINTCNSISGGKKEKTGMIQIR